MAPTNAAQRRYPPLCPAPLYLVQIARECLLM